MVSLAPSVERRVGDVSLALAVCGQNKKDATPGKYSLNVVFSWLV